MMRLISAWEKAMGFSQKTAIPASMAWSAGVPCDPEVRMRTPSRPPDASMSS
jgi:hypothetical protein